MPDSHPSVRSSPQRNLKREIKMGDSSYIPCRGLYASILGTFYTQKTEVA